MLALYFVTTFSYSLYFKQKAIVDVLMLAGLYTVRIVAGGVAVGVAVSPWLLAFSLFFFLSLAYVKRFTELQALPLKGSLRSRGYVSGDLEGLADLGVASGYIAVLVVALYINSPEVKELPTGRLSCYGRSALYSCTGSAASGCSRGAARCTTTRWFLR